LDEMREGGDRVAVAFSWNARDGSRTRWAQLLKLRNGRIVSMTDYASPKRALRAAGTQSFAVSATLTEIREGG
jgi:ketosteroid isomerase-like protein